MSLTAMPCIATPVIGATFLAADIGGTYARVGLVAPCLDGRHLVTVLEYRSYTCNQWSGPSAILEDFISGLGDTRLTHCVLAIAGYVMDDAVVNDNLPWKVSISQMREQLGIEHIAIINDFEAVAYASQFLQPGDITTIIETASSNVNGPVLVTGPGTGLGCAVLLPGVPYPSVMATEAGHTALAPDNEREIEILRLFGREHGFMSFEHALSGPGLRNLYRSICTLRQLPSTLVEPRDITNAALAHSDEAAVETLDVFFGLLGSFVGDMAIAYGARGGVFLAGGILPKVYELMCHSSFTERFLNKGMLRPYLEKVPVQLMGQGQHGVVGAASLYLARQAIEVRTSLKRRGVKSV